MALGGEAEADELWRLLPVVDSSLRQVVLDCIDTLRMTEAEGPHDGQRARLPKRDEAIAALLHMLDDEDASVRREAILGLGAFDEPEVIPVLIPLLKDESLEVVAATRSALDRLYRQTVQQNEGDE